MEICHLRELWKRRMKLLKELEDVEGEITKALELDHGTRKTGRKHLTEEQLKAAFRACRSE